MLLFFDRKYAYVFIISRVTASSDICQHFVLCFFLESLINSFAGCLSMWRPKRAALALAAKSTILWIPLPTPAAATPPTATATKSANQFRPPQFEQPPQFARFLQNPGNLLTAIAFRCQRCKCNFSNNIINNIIKKSNINIKQSRNNIKSIGSTSAIAQAAHATAAIAWPD